MEEPASNSSRYWLPRLQGVSQLAMPGTIGVDCDPWKLMGVLDSEPKPEAIQVLETLEEGIVAAVAQLGGYPCFLRTDESSAKHSGPKAYRLNGPGDVRRCIAQTLEDNLMKDLLPTQFLVRTWLDLEGGFTAFDQHLVAVEFRVFAEAGRIICLHPYWPQVSEDAIHHASVADFASILRRQGDLSVPDEFQLRELASRASQALRGAWSLDFAKTTDGAWFLIDAALMEDSYHDYTCPNCPPHIAARYRPE